MTTKQNETKPVSIEQLAEMINAMQTSQSELLAGQEKTAMTMQNIDQRITQLEGVQPKLDTEEKLQAAVEAVKPGLIGGFKQASTTKKVLVVTAGTALVAGAAYGTYKGVEYYKDRKAADLPLLAVEAVPSVSPAKSDALRQALK